MSPDTSEDDLLRSTMPFVRTLGIRTVASTPSEVRARLDWAEELCTSGGVLHGGAIMALADSTGGACAFLNLPEGAGTTTVESKTNFLRGVTEGQVEAVARPLHVGRRFVVVDTDLFDDRGKRVARVTQTQAVLI